MMENTVEMGGQPDKEHADSTASEKTSLLQQEYTMGKDFLESLSKQKIEKIEPALLNLLLFFFLGGTIAILASFLYYFIFVTCSPQTTSIQPFWTEDVYTSAFYSPASGLYPCQSFFQASQTVCASISPLTKSPTIQPVDSPSLSPTKQPVDSASSPQFCLVPCVLPGISCETYAAYNPSACNTAIAPNLGHYYGNFSSFSCPQAGDISCITQQDDGVSFNLGGVPSSITVVYLQCTSVVQSITNAIQYVGYCQLAMSLLIAIALIVRYKGYKSLSTFAMWQELISSLTSDKKCQCKGETEKHSNGLKKEES